jgi:hypothetical protein
MTVRSPAKYLGARGWSLRAVKWSCGRGALHRSMRVMADVVGQPDA